MKRACSLNENWDGNWVCKFHPAFKKQTINEKKSFARTGYRIILPSF